MGVAAERPLEDPPVAGPVEDGAPRLELADAVRRLLGVELGHARVVEELAADHRVAEVGLPGVVGVDMAERRGDATLGHDRVRLAEQRLADEADVAPAAAASIAARSPAPPAPMTRTSWGCGLGRRRSRAAIRSGSRGR